MIKMTFFDMKDVVFVIKIANCKKKCQTVHAPASGKPTGILEDLVDEGAFSAYLAPGTYIAHVETKAGINDVKFVVVRN